MDSYVTKLVIIRYSIYLNLQLIPNLPGVSPLKFSFCSFFDNLQIVLSFHQLYQLLPLVKFVSMCTHEYI